MPTLSADYQAKVKFHLGYNPNSSLPDLYAITAAITRDFDTTTLTMLTGLIDRCDTAYAATIESSGSPVVNSEQVITGDIVRTVQTRDRANYAQRLRAYGNETRMLANKFGIRNLREIGNDTGSAAPSIFSSTGGIGGEGGEGGAGTSTLLTGLSNATSKIIEATDTILQAFGYLQAQITSILTALTNHTGNGSNPHSTTKTQVGLGNVDNTSDLNKPISTTTQSALDAKQPTLISENNIKTINGNSVLGSGNLTISASASQIPTLTRQLFR